MSRKQSRRSWLKSSVALATGIAVTPFSGIASHPRKYKRIQTIEHDLVIPPQIPQLKARLLANENPYGPSPATIEAMKAALSRGNRYPMNEGMEFFRLIVEKEGLNQDHVLIGPGSTQLLDMVATELAGSGNVVTADPSYMAMVETIDNIGGKTIAVPLTHDGQHDLDAMESMIDDSVSLVYVVNPNNPTGTITDSNKLREFCRRVSDKVPVFIDEAYLDFIDDAMSHSMVDLVREGKNVIIARTFSKIYGMAGIRVGYICGLPDTIKSIWKQAHVEWGVSAASIAGAKAALSEQDFLTQCRKDNMATKQFVYQMLEEMEYDYMPSSTNFILFPIKMRPNQFQDAMFSKGVGIRVFEIGRKPYCRVSMGTMEEMEIFKEAFQEVVG